MTEPRSALLLRRQLTGKSRAPPGDSDLAQAAVVRSGTPSSLSLSLPPLCLSFNLGFSFLFGWFYDKMHSQPACPHLLCLFILPSPTSFPLQEPWTLHLTCVCTYIDIYVKYMLIYVHVFTCLWWLGDLFCTLLMKTRQTVYKLLTGGDGNQPNQPCWMTISSWNTSLDLGWEAEQVGDDHWEVKPLTPPPTAGLDQNQRDWCPQSKGIWDQIPVQPLNFL